MKKEEQLRKIIDTGIVAVIRTQNAEELVSICEALVDGGVIAVEITMTSPGALEAIYGASEALQGKAIVGAGSVLDAETARIAISAGAEFIVSPILNHSVIEMCKRYSKIVIPGAFTPTEIMSAWQAGADVVKVFPAARLGSAFFKDVKGPMPQVKLTPTGGINKENLGEFLNAGAEFVCVGSALINKQHIVNKNWTQITELAADYVGAVQAARTAKY